MDCAGQCPKSHPHIGGAHEGIIRRNGIGCAAVNVDAKDLAKQDVKFLCEIMGATIAERDYEVAVRIELELPTVVNSSIF